jgi:hypothetical protein
VSDPTGEGVMHYNLEVRMEQGGDRLSDGLQTAEVLFHPVSLPAFGRFVQVDILS